MNISRTHRDRINQFGLTVGTNMRLHAEVPLVVFLRLVQLWIPRLVLVLRRAGCIDDGRIHNGAGVHFQPVLLQIVVDQYKQLTTRIMCFKQMTELADRGFVRRGFAPQIDADESPHGARVIQGLCLRRIEQIEPVLQKVDAQHAFQADRLASRTFRLWIKRFDHLAQVASGDNLFHRVEKLFATGWLTVQHKAFFGEGSLMHSVNLQLARLN